MEIGIGLGGFVPSARPQIAQAAQARAPEMANAAEMPAADAVLGAVPSVSQNGADALAKEKAYAKVMEDRFNQDCQTCKSRRYQDGSSDPGVSFQTPQHVAPELSAAMVSSHEQEHVSRNKAKAEAEGGEVISSKVVLHGDICPECGRYYIAGGTTYTTTRHGGGQNGGKDQNQTNNGGGLNLLA